MERDWKCARVDNACTIVRVSAVGPLYPRSVPLSSQAKSSQSAPVPLLYSRAYEILGATSRKRVVYSLSLSLSLSLSIARLLSFFFVLYSIELKLLVLVLLLLLREEGTGRHLHTFCLSVLRGHLWYSNHNSFSFFFILFIIFSHVIFPMWIEADLVIMKPSNKWQLFFFPTSQVRHSLIGLFKHASKTTSA